MSLGSFSSLYTLFRRFKLHNQANRLSFIGASLSLMATYVASATAIPLYGLYQSVDGLTYSDLALSSVVYFIGAVIALIIFGRLSNHFGRKPISILSVLLAGLSCLVFLNIHSAYPLLAGRFLQGLACGLASTALAAWVVDCADTVPRWIAPAVISCGPMTGLTIGGLGSGLLVEYGPIPRQLPFFIVIGLTIASIVLLFQAKETMDRKNGALKSLKPSFSLPPISRKAYPIAACTFVATWALGGFFQAFGPAMAREQLHSTSAVAAAFVFASIMAPSSIGASLAGRYSAKTAQLAGMVLFTLFLGCVILSLNLGWLSTFLLASVFAGIAQGMVLTGSIRTMVSDIATEDRANVFAVIYATSYLGAAIPTLIAGRLSTSFSLLEISCGYGLLAIFASCVVVLSKVRNTSSMADSNTSLIK
nr:MFS transporter [Vibrio furnissii]